jgi:hypothetical protein
MTRCALCHGPHTGEEGMHATLIFPTSAGPAVRAFPICDACTAKTRAEREIPPALIRECCAEMN